MNRLNWRTVASTELALLLKKAKLGDSRAVGASTVYQLKIDGRDVLAGTEPFPVHKWFPCQCRRYHDIGLAHGMFEHNGDVYDD